MQFLSCACYFWFVGIPSCRGTAARPGHIENDHPPCSLRTAETPPSRMLGFVTACIASYRHFEGKDCMVAVLLTVGRVAPDVVRPLYAAHTTQLRHYPHVLPSSALLRCKTTASNKNPSNGRAGTPLLQSAPTIHHSRAAYNPTAP